MLTTILWTGLGVSLLGIHEVIRASMGSTSTAGCAGCAVPTKEETNYYKDTSRYLSQLTLDEIDDYVQSNYDLKYHEYRIYKTCSKDNKDLIIKHIAELSEDLGKPFTNRFKNY